MAHLKTSTIPLGKLSGAFPTRILSPPSASSIAHWPLFCSPSLLPLSLFPSHPPPLIVSTLVGAHTLPLATTVGSIPMIPTQGNSLAPALVVVMYEHTPPTIGSSRHVPMGSSFLEHVSMIFAHLWFVSSSSTPAGDHTHGLRRA